MWVASLVVLSGCVDAGASFEEHEVQRVEAGLHEDVIRVPSGVQDVSGPGLPTDRPELSRFGRDVVYTVEEAELPVFVLSIYAAEKQLSGAFGPSWLVRQGEEGLGTGRLESWFFPAFRPDRPGSILSGRGTIDRHPDGTPDFASLDVRFVEIVDDGEREHTLVTAAELGMPFGEIPQGARFSPDGRHLAFFAESAPVRGLYLYELERERLHRLTDGPDRDPTWTADGRRLFFYEREPDAQGVLESRVGVVRLAFGPDAVTADRRLLDPVTPAFEHEEHAAPLFGSDVILTHRRSVSGEAPHLVARRTCAGFRPVRIELALEGRPVVEAFRPASALYAHDVVLMGKLEGDSTYRVLALAPSTVLRILTQVALRRCPGVSSW